MMSNILPKIFVADDDMDILSIVTLMLRTKNYAVVATTDPNEIFRYPDADLPDLILLDVWMEGIDGRKVCKDVRQNDRTKNIPVLFISADSDIEGITQECNANGFVAKPFEMRTFLDTVERWL